MPGPINRRWALDRLRAPIDPVHVHQMRLGAVGRAVPLHRRDRAQADAASARDRPRRVHVSADERNSGHLLARSPVHHMHDAVLPRRRCEFASVSGVERGDDGGVPVAIVGADQLMPPFELSRSRVEGDQRVGEQIGSGPTVVVEVRSRIADRQQQQAGGAIETEGGPYRPPAMLDAGRALPRVASRLIGRGN